MVSKTTPSIEIEHLDPEDYLLSPALADDYSDVNGLHDLYDRMAFGPNQNLVLVGPKGVGKSLSIAAWAAKHGHPIVTLSCSEDNRKSDLYGHFVLRDGHTPFILGPVTAAFEIANLYGSCVLCLEEINALKPGAQKLLNPVCDFHRRVEVPTAHKVFELEPGKKLWVTGTMNTAVYGGVYSLNEDLTSRLNLLPLDYPTLEREKQLLNATLAKLVNSIPKKTFNAVLRLANETRQGEFDYALSTRDIVQIISNINAVGIESAMWIASGKFEDRDRATFKERAKSAFGIRL